MESCPNCGYQDYEDEEICFNCDNPIQKCECDYVCDECNGINGDHSLLCPNNFSSYQQLVIDGYD